VQAVRLVAQPEHDGLVVFVRLAAQIVTRERILIDLNVGVELQERPQHLHASSEPQPTVCGQQRTASVQSTVQTRARLYRIRRRDPPSSRLERTPLREQLME
jgi:hypothetical protein